MTLYVDDAAGNASDNPPSTTPLTITTTSPPANAEPPSARATPLDITEAVAIWRAKRETLRTHQQSSGR